ncbi:MAG: alanine dehydrogenase [Calditrichaceae bacterium]
MYKVGLLKEIKQFEGRVMLSPEGVKVLIRNGIDVFVERSAGEMCGFEDIQYERVGAIILPTMEKVLQKAELIVKVQPPQPVEYELLNESHILISFLNLVHNADRLKALMDTKTTFFGAEMIQDADGKYPLLMGMSEIAGKMAIHQGANLLTITEGGKGKLLSGTDNVKPATVTILGAGKVGRTAAMYACSNGANVNLLGLKKIQTDELDVNHPNLRIDKFSEEKLLELLPQTDILIVAIFSLKQYSKNVFITKEMVASMEPGSVLIDISIEQANLVETSHITSLEKPTYIVNDIVHYCVPNIAATVPLTASRIITKKIVPFVKLLASNGLKDALIKEPALLSALSIYKGKITNRYAADQHGYEFYNIFELLELNL